LLKSLYGLVYLGWADGVRGWLLYVIGLLVGYKKLLMMATFFYLATSATNRISLSCKHFSDLGAELVRTDLRRRQTAFAAHTGTNITHFR